MFKWVAGLCATIYLTLLIVGAPPDGVTPSEEGVAAIQSEPEQPTADPQVVEIASAADPEPLIETAAQDPLPEIVAPLNPTPILSVSLDTDEIVPAPAPAAVTLSVQQPAASDAPVAASTPVVAGRDDGVGEIWKVTGSRVNLRSGASTNSSVIGQTIRGDSAEVVELLGNGWAKVYILESGIEAFMSADFIARES